MEPMKLPFFLLAGVVFAGFALAACNSEPQPTQGDAEIVKKTPKNTNPASMERRKAAGATAKDMAIK